MYLKQVPKAIRSGLSSAVWSIPTEKSIYLTFDDGPSEKTEAILNILSEHDAKATFFLLGEQIQRHPEIVEQIRKSGHGIGNHGHAHLDGWKTTHEDYLANLIKGKVLSGSSDFRPPYGRMTPRQWRSTQQTERIVMWSIMPGDFDPLMNASSCLELLRSKSQPGSIIVLHDNRKSIALVLELLPRLLILFKEKGLQLEPLPSR